MVETIGMQQQQVLQMSPVAVKVSIAQASTAYEVVRSFNRELEKQTAREGDKTKDVTEVPKELYVTRPGERRRRNRRDSDRPGHNRRASDRFYQRRTGDRGLRRRTSDKGYVRRTVDAKYAKGARNRRTGVFRRREKEAAKAAMQEIEKVSKLDILA